MTMDLIFITNDPLKGAVAQEAGVDRVMIDLEILGKLERQGGLDTVISKHTAADIVPMRRVLDRSQLLVRVNPVHPDSASEIETCVGARVDIVMLPMFTGRDEVARFLDLVAGRARTCLLLETPQAFVRMDDILACPGIDEVHVGLNDLHLGMGLTFMFELLSHGVVEQIGRAVTHCGIKFGFGGVGRLSAGPLSARLILSEHVRLGSTQVLLSRDFQKVFDGTEAQARAAFKTEVAGIRGYLDELRCGPRERLEENAREVRRVVDGIVQQKRRA